LSINVTGVPALSLIILHQGEPKLFLITDARGTAPGFAGLVDGRQQERGQHADNADDHQQLDQRKSAPRRASRDKSYPTSHIKLSIPMS
jgi:hypothetical protein